MMYGTPMILLLIVLAMVMMAMFCAVESAMGSVTNDGRAITAADLLKLRTITDIEVARDGAFAVYAVESIYEQRDQEKVGTGKYEYRTHLWRVGLEDDGAEPVQLTFGARTGSGIAISPDGQWLAFVRGEELDEGQDKKKRKSQVWLLPMASAGEARVVTDLKFGAGSPVWHPSGENLLVTSSIPYSEIEGMPEWDLERPGLSADELARLKGNDDEDEKKNEEDGDEKEKASKTELIAENDLTDVREWLHKNATAKEKRSADLINRLHFQDELTLASAMKFEHLFTIDLTDCNANGIGAATQVTDGFNEYGGAVYNSDGSLIAFVDKPRDGAHPDRYLRSCVYVMNADGSGLRKLAGDEERSFGQPRFLPDGATLVATTSPTAEMWYQQEDVAEIDLAMGEYELLTEDWASYAGQMQVMEADGSVYFGTAYEGSFPLRGITSTGTFGIELAENAGTEVFDVNGGVIVAAATTVAHPHRLMAINRDGSGERVLHDVNAWVEERDVSLPTEHWITQPDGTKVQYWAMAPTDGSDGKASTVLEIHGGPSAMWGPGERSMWHEYQLMCAWGYGVVYANPRGSGGYGYDFQRGNHENWGVGPTGDVLAALDDAASKYNWIDTDDLFVTGGSYAGYLTAWIVSHDDRFKAAVAQRGVYELNTFFGEGNAWILVPWAMGGYPWEEATKANLERESPFSYVDQITTPLMIIHGSQDLRTGVSQSEMMFRALKELGRDVEYIRYPGAGHELSRSGDPKQRMDRLLRIVEFFERYRD